MARKATYRIERDVWIHKRAMRSDKEKSFYIIYEPFIENFNKEYLSPPIDDIFCFYTDIRSDSEEKFFKIRSLETNQIVFKRVKKVGSTNLDRKQLVRIIDEQEYMKQLKNYAVTEESERIMHYVNFPGIKHHIAIFFWRFPKNFKKYNIITAEIEYSNDFSTNDLPDYFTDLTDQYWFRGKRIHEDPNGTLVKLLTIKKEYLLSKKNER